MLKNILVVTLFIATALSISGCTHSPSTDGHLTLETNFEKDLDVNALKTAVIKSALDNKWEVENNWEVNKEEIHVVKLKKTHTQKAPVSAQSSKRGSKNKIDTEIHLNVEINKHSLKIYIVDEHKELLKGHYNKEEFNDDIETLEKAIYLDLIHQLI